MKLEIVYTFYKDYPIQTFLQKYEHIAQKLLETKVNAKPNLQMQNETVGIH